MKEKLYDNADSFAMSFDEEWQRLKCDDIELKIEKVIEILSDHPYVISNKDNAVKIAKFRIFSLKKFNNKIWIFYYWIELFDFSTTYLEGWKIPYYIKIMLCQLLDLIQI